MKQVLLFGLLLFSLAFVFTACGGNNNKEGNTTQTENKAPEQLAKDEMYTCSMHNEVMSSKTGSCPKCGMNLTKQKMTPEQERLMKEGTYVKSKEEQ